MIQIGVYKKSDEQQMQRLNDTLKSASLFEKEGMPAIRVTDEHIVVFFEDAPGDVKIDEVKDNLLGSVKYMKNQLVSYEAERRQWQWRLENAQQELEDMESTLRQTQEEGAKLPNEKQYNERKKALKDQERDLKAKIEGQGKAAGKRDQIDNLVEQIASFNRKIMDTQKDIDTALGLIKEIDNGDYKIHGQ